MSGMTEKVLTRTNNILYTKLNDRPRFFSVISRYFPPINPVRENCLAKGTQKSKEDKDQESINQEQHLTLGMKNGKNTRKHQTLESQEVSLFTVDNKKISRNRQDRLGTGKLKITRALCTPLSSDVCPDVYGKMTSHNTRVQPLPSMLPQGFKEQTKQHDKDKHET